VASIARPIADITEIFLPWDIVELTTDLTPRLEEEKTRIEASGGWIANNRVNGVLAVSRSFGDIEYKSLKDSSWNKQFSSDIIISKPQVANLHFLMVCDHS
jgi:serine/threonine protein phosphatase PrpC